MHNTNIQRKEHSEKLLNAWTRIIKQCFNHITLDTAVVSFLKMFLSIFRFVAYSHLNGFFCFPFVRKPFQWQHKHYYYIEKRYQILHSHSNVWLYFLQTDDAMKIKRIKWILVPAFIVAEQTFHFIGMKIKYFGI